MEQGKKSKEIDLLAIWLKIWSNQKDLAVFLVASLIIGIIVALSQQKRYVSQVVLAPEATSMGMSQNLSDIAGAIGMDLGGGSKTVDAIYPEIYPEVFASSDFVVKLFDIPVDVNGVRKTYYNHLKEDTRIPFWSYPMIWIGNLFASKTKPQNKSKVNPFCLTKEQDGICGTIKKNIECQLNKGTNLITIALTDTDPRVAACLADTLQRRLQDYITLYRTQKARNDLYYAKRINKEAKAMYEKARQKYSSFSDANTDVLLKSYQSKIEDLENDMQLKFNSYSQTAQQVQKAEEKVQENTPAFTMIQSASVPLLPSGTPRSMIVVLFLIVGVVCDTFWVLLVKSFILKSRKNN